MRTNRWLPAILLLMLAAIAAYRWLKTDTKPTEKQAPIAVTATNDSLSSALTAALVKYMALKDALVAAQAAEGASQAKAYASAIEQLPWSAYAGDSTLVLLVKTQSAQIAAQSHQLAELTNIEEQRKIFQGISDGSFDLLRTVQYKGNKVYQQYCPMAFDNQGAAWMSMDANIVNPYFGKKMLTCGELRDSIAFNP